MDMMPISAGYELCQQDQLCPFGCGGGWRICLIKDGNFHPLFIISSARSFSVKN